MLPLYDLNRPSKRPYINWGLIGLNAAIFLIEILVTSDFALRPTATLFGSLGLVPFYVYGAVQGVGTAYLGTLLTSMFLHASLWHIGGNMLFLFVFGGRLEDILGHKKYLGFYLLCGIAGGLTQVFISVASGPPDVFIPSVGASGAISGVLAGYFVYFPRARILSLLGYFIVPIRAFWFIGLWFVLQLLLSYGGGEGGVAYGAHIGGFAFGLALAVVARAFIRPGEYE
ncbi:MAG: rhomboid family intramembrane serine protease [Thaumarchaeota archaeon]|nr:rhomboid family intramembrane serine protease [Nitrososphaerota archaeon]